MPRYIDADALLNELKEEIEFDSPMYNEVENNWLKRGLRIARKDVKHFPSADVVPRSEVEILKVRLEMAEKAYKGLSELYHTDTDALVEARRKTEAEVAREIFAEIEKLLYIGIVEHVNCIDAYVKKGYAELKKKYVPDTNVRNITAAEAIANFHEAVHEYYTDNNHCVVCGESVPKRRQVCGMCEVGMDTLKNYNKNNNQGG
jgi:hypothetical protein